MRILDRTESRIPRPWRTIVDWFVTIAVAIAFVLAFQAQVAKPYRIPSPSMEPTLHCAKPVANCEGRFSDRVIANRLAYRFRDPERGDIVVFKAPVTADRCGLNDGGSAFVKRVIGLPGEVVSARAGSSISTATVSSSPISLPLGADTRTASGHASHQTTTWSSATTACSPATLERGARSPATT